MKLLLDTHVLVWAESLPERLGAEAKQWLLDPANSLWVSPVTTLELSRLISLGRLSLRKTLEAWLEDARLHLSLEDAAFTHGIAIQSYQLPGEFHKDPADRMLVATAREGGYTLITADDLILGYPHVQVLDARR